MAETKSKPVLFEERRTDNGARAGVARLNVEKWLNSLSLEMIDLLSERLSAWATDPAIAFVILEAAGEKAFCAGADLHSLYRTMPEITIGLYSDVGGIWLLDRAPGRGGLFLALTGARPAARAARPDRRIVRIRNAAGNDAGMARGFLRQSLAGARATACRPRRLKATPS